MRKTNMVIDFIMMVEVAIYTHVFLFIKTDGNKPLNILGWCISAIKQSCMVKEFNTCINISFYHYYVLLLKMPNQSIVRGHIWVIFAHTPWSRYYFEFNGTQLAQIRSRFLTSPDPVVEFTGQNQLV